MKNSKTQTVHLTKEIGTLTNTLKRASVRIQATAKILNQRSQTYKRSFQNMSTQYEHLSDYSDLSLENNDNDTTINPLYSLDMGSSKHSERDNKINMALLTKISKNIDFKEKKSSHNHVLAPMHIKNDIIMRPKERGRQPAEPINYNILATQDYIK